MTKPNPSKNATILLCIGVFLMIPMARAVACLWDTETLLEERTRFPNTLEIITGKFPRHSTAYYQWRLKDRLAKRESDPDNQRLLDDIAVSYEKLGQLDSAIEIARQQLVSNPTRYESLANLGTFLIHDGQWQEGLSFIQRAIEVNPNAHFGREKYQAALVKYLISKSDDGQLRLPLDSERLEQSIHATPFLNFLATELNADPEKPLTADQRSAAIQGILGMMRFSKHDHPVLLEVLGELSDASNARRLAVRCYLLAAKQSADAEVQAAYRKLAIASAQNQHVDPKGNGNYKSVPLAEIKKQFEQELSEGAEWFKQLSDQEAAWIEAGADVDTKFNETYRQRPPTVSGLDSAREASYRGGGVAFGQANALQNRITWIGILLVPLAVATIWWWSRRRPAV